MRRPLRTLLARALLGAIFLLFLGSAGEVHAAVSEWAANAQAKVRLVTPWQVAPRQGPLRLGLHFQLAPGWHVYWKNAGSAGYPPAVVVQPKEILGETTIFWPAPERYELPGGLVAFGYEKEVVYPLAVPDRGPLEGPTLALSAEVDYLVCRETCFPYRTTLRLDQPVGDLPEPDPASEALIETWWSRLPKVPGEIPGVQANGAVDARHPDAPVLEVRVLGPTVEAGHSELFLESQDEFEVGKPTVRAMADGVVFRVPLQPRSVGKALPATLPFAWTATGLRRGAETFSLTAQGAIPVTAGETTTAPVAPPPEEKGPRALLAKALRAARAGLFQLATPAPLALLFGLLLALRPTPWPAAPRSVSEPSPDAGPSAPPKGPTAREGLAAAATGILAGSWLVAALAAWAQLKRLPLDSAIVRSDPLLGGILTALALLLALNLWGLAPVPLPRASGDGRAPGTGSLFVAGLFAAPLALAWPLPTLAAPFRDAQAHGPIGLAALLAATGLGLAAPLLVALLAPAVLRLLPNPASARGGGVRTLLGFLAAAGVLHLLSQLARSIRPEGLAFLELALLGAALGAWLLGRSHPSPAEAGWWRPQRAFAALLLLAALVSVPWLAERFRFAPRQAIPPFELDLKSLPGGFVR